MKKPGLNFNPGLVLIRLQTTKPWALKTGRQFVSRPKKKKQKYCWWAQIKASRSVIRQTYQWGNI